MKKCLHLSVIIRLVRKKSKSSHLPKELRTYYIQCRLCDKILKENLTYEEMLYEKTEN